MAVSRLRGDCLLWVGAFVHVFNICPTPSHTRFWTLEYIEEWFGQKRERKILIDASQSVGTSRVAAGTSALWCIVHPWQIVASHILRLDSRTLACSATSRIHRFLQCGFSLMKHNCVGFIVLSFCLLSQFPCVFSHPHSTHTLKPCIVSWPLTAA